MTANTKNPNSLGLPGNIVMLVPFPGETMKGYTHKYMGNAWKADYSGCQVHLETNTRIGPKTNTHQPEVY